MESLASSMNYNYELVLDDSYSMKGSNWRELKETIREVMQLILTFNGSARVRFLNHHKVTIVKNMAQVEELFQTGPCGTTPFEKVPTVMFECQSIEKKSVVIVVTDGDPDEGMEGLRAIMKLREESGWVEKCWLNFVMCTKNDKVVKFYNEAFDEGCRDVDVIDDYASELEEVRKKNPAFSRADWLVKIISANAKMDKLDESSKSEKKEESKREETKTDEIELFDSFTHMRLK